MSKSSIASVEKIRRGFPLGSHINVTQLGRSTAWRADLEKLSAMTVLDRNQTAAVILTPEAFRSLLEYVDAMEQEVDALQVETLLKAREGMDDWKTGQTLSDKAKEIFLSRRNELRGLLDGDQ